MLGRVAAALLALLAGQFDVDGLVTGEVRVGEGPLTADGTIRKGIIGVVTPDLQLSYLSRTSDIRLDYAPRAFWREPNDESTYKPLFLHQVNFTALSQMTERLKLTANANVSAGESDYTILTQILPNQPTQPSVVDFLSITAAVGATEDLSRTSRVGLNLSAINRRPLGATADAAIVEVDASGKSVLVPPFPRQTTVIVEPNYRLILSRRDTLTVNSPVSYGTFANGISNGVAIGRVDIFLAVPQIGWLHRLSRTYNLRLALGVALVHVQPKLDTSSPVAPVAEIGLDMLLDSHGGVVTKASGGVRLDYAVDPVLGTAGPRAALGFGLSSTLNPDWLVGIEASYSTVFLGTPPPMAPQIDETLVAVAIPIRCRATDHLITEFGFRWADRGPSLDQTAFGFHQRQLWLYFALTATTRRPITRMVQ